MIIEAQERFGHGIRVDMHTSFALKLSRQTTSKTFADMLSRLDGESFHNQKKHNKAFIHLYFIHQHIG